MAVAVADFNGDPNIGLYAKASDDIALIGLEAPRKFVLKLKKTLKVDTIRFSIGGSSLIGVFTVFSRKHNKFFVSGIATDSELDVLRSQGVNFDVLNVSLTALGNNLLLGNGYIMANPNYSLSDIRTINKITGLNVRRSGIAGFNVPGSVAVINSSKAAITASATLDDIKSFKKVFHITPELATVTQGTGFLSSAIIYNTQGLVISNSCFGIELARLEKILL